MSEALHQEIKALREELNRRNSHARITDDAQIRYEVYRAAHGDEKRMQGILHFYKLGLQSKVGTHGPDIDHDSEIIWGGSVIEIPQGQCGAV